MLRLWIHPSNPSWLLVDCHYFLCGRLLVSCWWFLLQLGLLFGAIGEIERSLSCQVLVVVLYAHRTLGNSSGHAPFASSNRALMILSRARFVTFVWPLAWGWPGDENQFLIPNPEQKSLKPQLSNCHPLFDMIFRDIPNRQTIFFHTKF